MANSGKKMVVRAVVLGGITVLFFVDSMVVGFVEGLVYPVTGILPQHTQLPENIVKDFQLAREVTLYAGSAVAAVGLTGAATYAVFKLNEKLTKMRFGIREQIARNRAEMRSSTLPSATLTYAEVIKLQQEYPRFSLSVFQHALEQSFSGLRLMPKTNRFENLNFQHKFLSESKRQSIANFTEAARTTVSDRLNRELAADEFAKIVSAAVIRTYTVAKEFPHPRAATGLRMAYKHNLDMCFERDGFHSKARSVSTAVKGAHAAELG